MARITITQTNIDDARQADAARQLLQQDGATVPSSLQLARCCPVAQACKDAGFDAPVVSADKVRLTDPDGRWRYDLPHEAIEFVKAYDESGVVEPLTFDLDARISITGVAS